MIMIEPNEEPFEPGGGRENPEVWYIQIVLIDSKDPILYIDLILYYERQARRRQQMASADVVRMTWVMPE